MMIYIGGMNYYPVSKRHVITESDFAKIHESGRNVYYLNRDNNFIKCNTASDLKRAIDLNSSCDYIFFVSEETIKNKSIKGLAESTKEMEKLHNSYINNLYKLLVGSVDKIERKK